MSSTYAIIMAGGAGTRFWPASRGETPKQLLPLAGDPSESLLAATVRRLSPLILPDHVYIATNTRLARATARAVPSVPPDQILAEPVGRNTAPCIGWATSTIARRDSGALIAVLPSDHFIRNETTFRSVVEQALSAAMQGYLVTVGIVPTRAETGYGYIEQGAPLSNGAFSVARFIEKPDRARAEQFVRGRKHLWNAGMFFFRAETMQRSILAHLPELARGLIRLDEAAASGSESDLLANLFPTFPSISIDHGVLEKADKLAVVPGDFGWSDVGSWESAWELAEKDAQGNAVPTGTVTIDSSGNLVRDLSGAQKLVALLGVHDLVIVQTEEAVLVMPRERAQDVRAIVDALKARNETRLL